MGAEERSNSRDRSGARVKKSYAPKEVPVEPKRLRELDYYRLSRDLELC